MAYRRRKKQVIPGLTIEDIAAEGKGVTRSEGKVYFVERAIPGDVVDIVVDKNKKDYGVARIKTLHQPSDLRKEAFCSHFGLCGGCKWQHIDYTQQLKFKENIVAQALQRIGKVEIPEVNPIMACEATEYFRNKLEFSFTNRRWIMQKEMEGGNRVEDRNGLGFFIPGQYDKVVNIEHCHLLPDPANDIRNSVKQYGAEYSMSFFDLNARNGLLRNLMVRVASTGELLVLLVTTADNQQVQDVLKHVDKEFPQITSLQYIVNTKKNDAYFDLEARLYSGEKFIKEKLGNYYFKIGPKSFFQTNTKQAERLYDEVVRMAEIGSEDVVYDLYSGVGSIGIYVSGFCKKVLGIEDIEAAVADAKENAALNKVENCEFIAGDVRKVLSQEKIEAFGRADVVITDPPRAGMHPEVVETLLNVAPQKIVYVSCNPSTQARDIQALSVKYEVVEIQPVDMFPHTPHIENIVLLRQK